MWFYLASALNLASVIIAVGLYFLFRGTMNKLQYIGPLYWITRDTGSHSDPHVCRAFMRGTSPPFKIGKGIQFRWSYYTFQVGICHNAPVQGEMEGLMYILEAEDMNLTPEEISALP